MKVFNVSIFHSHLHFARGFGETQSFSSKTASISCDVFRWISGGFSKVNVQKALGGGVHITAPRFSRRQMVPWSTYPVSAGRDGGAGSVCLAQCGGPRGKPLSQASQTPLWLWKSNVGALLLKRLKLKGTDLGGFRIQRPSGERRRSRSVRASRTRSPSA